MIRKLLLLSLFTASTFGLWGQVTIERCYELSQLNYPLIKQYGLIEQSRDYNISTISKGYLPQVELSAGGKYLSQTVEIPIELPGYDPLSKLQYSAEITASQSLWDGGTIAAQKAQEQSRHNVERASIDVTMYHVRERINDLYFGILLSKELLNQLELFTIDLESAHQKLAAQVESGTATPSDLNLIKIEQVELASRSLELQHSQRAYLAMLSQLTATDITNASELVVPHYQAVATQENFRPELSLYQAMVEQAQQSAELVDASIRPKLSLYASGGVGRPGLNMLDNTLSPYFIVGASFKWNFGALYGYKNKRRVIDNSIQGIELEQETFLFNTRLSGIKEDGRVAYLEDVIRMDDENIRLRSDIKHSWEFKLSQGIISTLDYTQVVNDYQRAVLDKLVHQIELLETIYDIKYLNNR